MNDKCTEVTKKIIEKLDQSEPNDTEEVAKAKKVLADHFRNKLSDTASANNARESDKRSNPSNCEACGEPIICYKVVGLGYMCLHCGFSWDGESETPEMSEDVNKEEA